MVENNSLNKIPKPGQLRSRVAGMASMSDAYSIIRNTVLIVVVIAVLTWFAVPVITDRVSHYAINSIENRLFEELSDGNRLRKGIRQILSDVADNVEVLMPNARDDLLSDVRTIVVALKPFINEIKPLYCPPQVIKENGG